MLQNGLVGLLVLLLGGGRHGLVRGDEGGVAQLVGAAAPAGADIQHALVDGILGGGIAQKHNGHIVVKAAGDVAGVIGVAGHFFAVGFLPAAQAEDRGAASQHVQQKLLKAGGIQCQLGRKALLRAV